MKRFLRNSWRVLRAMVVSLGLLVLLALWALRSDWAQAQMVPVVASLVSEALGVPVEVGSVDIDLPAHAVLGQVRMRDPQGQTLFAVHELKLGFSSFSVLGFLLRPGETHRIRVSHVQVEEPEAHFYRSRADSSWNYAFLSGEDDTDTTPSRPLPLQLDFPAVELRGGRFSMIDSTRSDSLLLPGTKLNFRNIALDQVALDASFHMTDEQRIHGALHSLSLQDAYTGHRVQDIRSDYLIVLHPERPSRLNICMENARIRIGRTLLDFDAELDDIRPDTGDAGFTPVFTANLRPSEFDFQTIGSLVPGSLPLREPLHVQGYLWGDRDGIYSDSLDIGLMQYTRLRTNVALTNYADQERLKFKMGIVGGTLSFEELQALLPDTDIPLRGIVRMQGPISGNLSQIKAPKLAVQYMDHTRLHVDARLFEYTKGDDLFMDIKFSDSQFSFAETKRLLPGMNLPPWLARFGTCSLYGSFLGGVNDFVVNTDMGSAYGAVSSNLHLILPPKARDISYEGWMKTKSIDFVALDAQLPVESRNFNFEGRIKGHGTTWGKMVADIDGELVSSDIEGYLIDTLHTKELKINGYHITGGAEVHDRQGDASVTVDLDVPDSAQHYVVFGDVKRLDMAHYGLLPSDSVFLTAVMNVDVAGKQIEDYTGRVRFLQTLLTRDGSTDSLNVRNASLTSKIDSGGVHQIRLRSSVADMGLSGAFKYEKVISVVGGLAREGRLFLKNNDSLTTAYYAAKVPEPEEFQVKDTIWTKDELNHVLAFFELPLYVEPGTEFRAKFEHAAMDVLELELAADSLSYGNVGMRRDSLYLNLAKEGTENYFLGQGYLELKRLSIGKGLHFEDVSFEPTADANQVDYFMRARQADFGSEYVINAQTNFKPGGEINSRIHAASSKISIRGKTWRFSGGNSIDHYYQKPPSLAKVATDSVISRYFIRGMKLTSEGQEINIGGVVSRDRSDLLNVDIRNLDISNVLAVLDSTRDMDGTLKRATFGTWNLLSGQPSLIGSGEVQDFRYHRVDSIGMRFNVAWPHFYGPDYAGMRVVIGRWGQDSLITKGWYNVANDSLHFDTDSSSIQLSWIEPFVEGTLSDMEGRVTIDKFKIRGTANKPKLDGVAHFTNTAFKVDYFNNPFRIGDGELRFDDESIDIADIVIQDTARGTAKLNGRVWFEDSMEVMMDLRVNQIRNLRIMDTRKEHNELFYGRVVLDGDSARVHGNALSPVIEAWVNSGDGTWLDIPISDYTSASRLDFVNFVRHGDTLQQARKINYGGMTMSLTVHALDNARVRLIFDEFVGDVIEAWGEGTLNVKLTESGEFLMFGAYNLSRGDYHFTMENILNKKFVVNPGGRLSWNGDPFEADVNLDAIYEVSADISSIVPNAGGNRVPVQIVMHMKGSLLSPEITLELRLDQLSEQDVLGLASYFRGIQYDEQELNKQVVSLLMFRRFAGGNTAAAGGAANVTSSISELVSNQVNHWLSQAFNDPNLGLEVKSEDFQDVQLALRASLFNDRVTVERNGTIIGNNSGSLSIGDLSVLIKVLPKPDTLGTANPNAGQLVLEIFNREDATLSNDNNVSRGSGLFYKKDFDRIQDIFERRKKPPMRREETPELAPPPGGQRP